MHAKIVRLSEDDAAVDVRRKANHREADVLEKEAGLLDFQYEDSILATCDEAWRRLRPVPVEVAFELGVAECEILAKAAQVGILTKEYPMLYQDELQLVEDKLQPLPAPPYFARLSRCSTKGGKGGVGPFHTARQIVAALVTSYRCMSVFERLEPFGLYLLPFRPHFDCDKEFRVFVHNHKMTAISQYNEAEDCCWGRQSDADMQQLAKHAAVLLDNTLKEAAELNVALPDCFTFDIFCHADQNFAVELIELNSFGAQMAAGSCLFDWIQDYDILYGLSDVLELRLIG